MIDCARLCPAAVGTLSPWELVLHPQEIKAIPVIAVLTIAATGSGIILLLSRIRIQRENRYTDPLLRQGLRYWILPCL